MKNADYALAPADSGRQAAATARPSGASSLKLRTLLLPTDCSEPAARAVEYAARFMIGTGARLILLHVLELLARVPIVADDPDIWIRAEVIEEYYAGIERSIRERLAKTKEWLRAQAIDVETSIENVGRSSVYEHIVQRARQEDADLIVMATHGYTGFRHFRLGSTAERVVQHATCPVLVVR
jgi:universal stress protein A